MNAVERAAVIIGREYGPCNDDVNHRGTEAHDAAEALADAGLLLTDDDRAVLDAAAERGAQVITAMGGTWKARTPLSVAQALIDAGWHDGPHLTDADRAVLDAADAMVSGSMKTGLWVSHSPATAAALIAAVRARREAQTPDSLPGCLAADRARQEVGAAMSGMPKVACPETWEAKTVCNAWGAPSSHGCAKTPGHDGEHRCACGRARREGGQT